MLFWQFFIRYSKKIGLLLKLTQKLRKLRVIIEKYNLTTPWIQRIFDPSFVGAFCISKKIQSLNLLGTTFFILTHSYMAIHTILGFSRGYDECIVIYIRNTSFFIQFIVTWIIVNKKIKTYVCIKAKMNSGRPAVTNKTFTTGTWMVENSN